MKTRSIRFTHETIKSDWFADAHMAQLFTYLLVVSAHDGFHFDGIDVAPGTTVASFKTIAAETGLSYYRVKKCIRMLEAMGRLVITRHKSLAIITITDFARYTPAIGEEIPAAECQQPTVEEKSADIEDTTPEFMPAPAAPSRGSVTVGRPLSRAERRRLAREEAKAARRAAVAARL